MASLVTLEQAKRHLKLAPPTSPLTEEDEDVQEKLDVAESVVLTYVTQRRDDNEAWTEEVATWTPEGGSPYTAVPKAVQQAILGMLTDLFRFRGDDSGKDAAPARGQGELPQHVVALLYPFRDPGMA